MPKLNSKVNGKPKIVIAPRKVIYESYKVNICTGPKAIDVKLAKEILGWEENEKSEIKDKVTGKMIQSLLQDKVGRYIYCHNNIVNRPLYPEVYKNLEQEILERNWVFNGEPIIIGKTGLVLNGQHTLVALIRAAQRWRKDDSEDVTNHWKTRWPEEPTLEKLVVMGVEENDKTINTMDTCKPRSLMDVIYRCEYFKNLPSVDRRRASQICANACMFMWKRLRLKEDAYAPRKTHSEYIDFLNRHERLLRCVKHVMTEDVLITNAEGKSSGKRALSQHLTPGTIAGLCYLMGCSNSDGIKYQAQEKEAKNERVLNWDTFDRATEYWTSIASRFPNVKVLLEYRELLKDKDSGEDATVEDRIALFVKGWNLFNSAYSFAETQVPIDPKLSDKAKMELEVKRGRETDKNLKVNMSIDNIKLKYIIDEGVSRLQDDDITIGGIDIGPAEKLVEDGDGDTVEERKAKVTQEKLDKKVNGKPKKTKEEKEKDKKAELRKKQGFKIEPEVTEEAEVEGEELVDEEATDEDFDEIEPSEEELEAVEE